MNKKSYKVELHRSLVDGQYWWRLLSKNNGKVLATSELYKRKSSAYRVAMDVAIKLGAKLIIKA